MLNGLALAVFFLMAWNIAAIADEAKNADEIRIVAFGTSFTRGQGVSLNEAFPARLEELLRADGLNVRVKNEGVSGETTLDLIRRVNYAVPEGTQVVIFEYAFGNDHNKGIKPIETVVNSDKIIAQLVARKIQVLLVIRAFDQEKLQRFTNLFSGVVARNGISYIAIEQPKSSILPDGWAHPTVKAHGEIAASMVPPVKQLIERARGTRN